jgi:hypothetical protein
MPHISETWRKLEYDMPNPINGIASGAQNINRGVNAAQSIIAANRAGNAVNIAGVANDIAKLSIKDPKAAANALEGLKKQLNPVHQGELARALPEAISTQQRAAGKVPDGLTPAQKEVALDVTQLGLDIVGIFEPTPFADITSGLISAFRGDWLGAGISTLSLVPYIGDAAKLGKLGKMAKTVATAIDIAKTDSKFAKALRPMMENLNAALNKIPGAALDKLPASAREQIVEMRNKVQQFLSAPIASTKAALTSIPTPKKVVNTGLPHATERAVERNIFGSAKEAREGLKKLSDDIGKKGFPQGTILDSPRTDRVLVPVGNNGYAVYQIQNNGNAVLKTVLNIK